MKTVNLFPNRMFHEFAFVPSIADGATRLRRGRRAIVREWERGVLFRNGALVGTVEPGAVRRWRSGYELHGVDLRPCVLTVPTQEVPTADGVTVKVTIAARVAVTDAVTYVTASQNASEHVYLAVQIAVREVLAVTPLETLLSGRAEMRNRVGGAIRDVDALGVSLESVELKDVVLPSELKRAQADVLLARAEAVAALERARGETAALRHLANAAGMAKDNPMLLQLRLVQQLASSTGHTVVVGTPPPATA